jgi:two-component system, LytTR family, response regulator
MNKMVTAILVDDEYYSLEGLKKDLEDLGNIKVLATYENGFEALSNIGKLQPDIVFLDIEMPGINGLELFCRLIDECPQTRIVFVTAYNQYAIEAFELNAMDYILKPVKLERLKKTIERLSPNKTTLVREGILINCFGHLTIKVNGFEVDIPWRTKKAEEMFAYLVCVKGEFVSKEKLAEILWPELDPQKSKANFYLAYHYLKKQSEKSGIMLPMESARGKIRLNMEQIEADIVRFEIAVSKLQEITEDNIKAAEKTVDICKEPLLDGHYYEWSMEIGWYYEILQKELNLKIAKYYKKIGNREKENYYFMRAAK